MVVSCNSCDFPDHKDPPFSKAKAYHSEVKPDTATLKLEMKRHWKAYFSTTCQPCPTNWKIDKCHKYLLSHPIPTSEKADLDFLIRSYIILGHLISLTFILIILWLKTASEVPLGKHIMPKLERNWTEGTLRYSKTSTN